MEEKIVQPPNLQFGKWLKPIQIGELKLKHNVLPAPLAGYTDLPFRNVLRAYGAHLTFLEMLNLNSISPMKDQTVHILQMGENEYPIGIQLLVHEAQQIMKHADFLKSLNVQLIDINLGCPMPKVTSKGGGAALMQYPETMERIVEVASSIFPGKITAKIRIGYHEPADPVEIIQRLENAGAKMITVHGRKGTDSYTTAVNFEWISQAKQAASVPVIGNGSIFSVEDAQRMFAKTGVDGIMLGRGILQRPKLMAEILTAGKVRENKTSEIDLIKNQYRDSVELYGEKNGLLKMRKKIIYWLGGNGFPLSLKREFTSKESLVEVLKLLDDLK